MRVAVVTLTRDRLEYTKHCFQTLNDNAGCDFDWYVFDQGSTDGTDRWLIDETNARLLMMPVNIGICAALNHVLFKWLSVDDYDVIVRFDNDCEVIQPDTLKAVCEVACEYGIITAPHVLGLNNPPQPIGTMTLEDGQTLDETTILGGIFMAIPAFLFSDPGYLYRFDESHPPYTGDEAICPWYRARGGSCGYLNGYSVNHYLTSEGQKADDPEYQHRKEVEMGLVPA